MDSIENDIVRSKKIFEIFFENAHRLTFADDAIIFFIEKKICEEYEIFRFIYNEIYMQIYEVILQ